MKTLNPKLYDKDYYLNICLGSDEFKKSGGKKLHPRLENLLKKLTITSTTKVLDIGCGRGDITLFISQKADQAIGIDYSKDAIELANSIKKNFPKTIQKKNEFKVMNAKKLEFPDNTFDLIICIDVLEHLYQPEVEEVMKEIKRVLKKDGILFLHTGTNKILYNYTYKYYTLPINKLLTKIDKVLSKKQYNSLPNDPRTEEEKKQHVNEPTYFYLQKLKKRYKLEGKIETEIGYIKPVKNIKTQIYNFLIALYPISTIFPLNMLFGWIFIGKLKNKK